MTWGEMGIGKFHGKNKKILINTIYTGVDNG